jgi:SAM-dependent methyltransferase
MSGSISFDRASEYYDQTRSLEPATMEQVLTRLLAELHGTHCLEIGVGTGRFAIPLHRRGVSMVGLDLSHAMLEKLRAKAAGRDGPRIVRGDATHLPFLHDTFDSALAVHVLHLIPEWRRAVDELVRVVRPGGRILINVGGFGWGEWRDIQMLYSEVAGIDLALTRPGPSEPAEVDVEMERRGIPGRSLPTIHTTVHESYNELIAGLERGIYSFTWSSDRSMRTRGANAVRAWLAGQGKNLNDTLEIDFSIRTRAYDLPA